MCVRSTAIVLSGVVAIALGVCAAGMFQLAGLVWDNGAFASTGQWEAPESGFGVAIAVVLLFLSLCVLVTGIAVGTGGNADGRRRRRILTAVVTASSAVAILVICGLALAAPRG